MKFLLLLPLLLTTLSAFAATTTCGEVSCADALDGCSVGANADAPIVFRPLSKKLEGCASACVTGTLAVGAAPDGKPYSYFRSVAKVTDCQEN